MDWKEPTHQGDITVSPEEGKALIDTIGSETNDKYKVVECVDHTVDGTSGPDEILNFSEEDAVKGIQTYLIGRGHADVGNKDGEPDGMFGRKSETGLATELRQVQKEAGLPQNGEYTAETRQALLDRAQSLSPDSPQRDALQGFVQGLDALKQRDVNGQSGLDRIYNPANATGPAAGVCTVDSTQLQKVVQNSTGGLAP